MAIVEQFRSCLPHLQIVDSSDRPWRSHACNVGAQAASGEVLVFCDADDQVGAGWLTAMNNALRKSDFVACRVDFKKLNQPDASEHFKDHPQHTGLQQTWYPPYVLFAGGGTLGVKRSLHEAAGGFDESLYRCQDIDYCYKLQRAGTELQFVHDAVLHIRCHSDLVKMFRQSRLWAEHSVLMYKRYGGSELHSYAWRRYAREWGNIIKTVPNLVSDKARYEWFCRVAWQVGFLLGSVKYRVRPVSW